MAERQQSEFWIDFGDEGSPRSIKDRARWHEGRRQRVIASILLELHLMACTEIIPRTARSITLVRARWQDDFGSADKQTQAAHCAPRQLIIRSSEPHRFLLKDLPDRADFLKGYFAKTSTLPENFNKADSRCERFGLVEAFRNSCVSAISSGQQSKKLKIQDVSIALKAAFQFYKDDARKIFLAASERLNKKLIFPKPLPENERKWKEQLLITQSYAFELRHSTAVSTITRLGELEDLINIYKKI